jgi:hypothetical protein
MKRLATVLICLAACGAAQASSLPQDWQKGMNLAAFRFNDFSGDRFYYWLKQLRRHDHAGEVMFVTRWLQYWKDPLRSDDVNATDIQPAYGTAADCAHRPRTDYTACQTPTLGAERKAIEFAEKIGLKVAIKPLVDVGRSADTQVDRKDVNFKDPAARDAWFASYRAMLAQYARLARDTHADMLVIGTGLTGMADQEGEQVQWRALIADIRSGALMGDDKGGFAGKLTYATRWDAIYNDTLDQEHDFFWDDLDSIGVEGFFPLISGKDPRHDDPSVDVLRQGWGLNFLLHGDPPGVMLSKLHLEYQKPVVLTGLGYLSRGGTSAAPFKGDATQAAAGGKVNEQAQERPYKAAFAFWLPVAKQGWFKGIYFWNWLPKLGSVKGNGDYTPQGKSAESELCVRWGGQAKACRPSRMPR